MAIRATTALVNKLAQQHGIWESIRDMQIFVYSGSQPADPDAIPTGNNLLVFTLDGNAFVAGTEAFATIVFSGATGSLDTVTVGGLAYNLLSASLPIVSGDLGTSADNVAADINARPNPFGVTAISDGVDTVTLTLPGWLGQIGNSFALATTETTVTVVADATFAGGVEAVNGMTFDFPAASGVISKPISEAWQGVGAVAGTAGWFRAVAGGASVSGSGLTEIRFDGNIATSGGDLTMGTLTVEVGAIEAVSSLTVTQPKSAT